MANYSDIFPLNVGGSSIAGFNWTEQTTDFTAVANEAYYCNTALGNILMTLPSNPNPGDEVAFLLIGANAVNITTTDNIKSEPLATDFAKQVAENYLMVILSYVDGTVGWDWNARYDSAISNSYIGGEIDLSYQSLNDTNGVIYYYGSSGNTTAFTNPVTSGAILASAAGTSALSGGTVDNFFDRSTSLQYLYINGDSSNRARVEVYLPGILKLDDIVLKTANNIVFLKTFNIKGWNTPDTYETSTTLLSVVNETTWTKNDFKRFTVNSPTYYANYALEVLSATNDDGYLRLAEIELYGLLAP